MSDETKNSGPTTVPVRTGRGRIIKGIIALAAVGIVAGITRIPPKNRETPPGEAPPVKVTVMEVVAQKEVADLLALPAGVEPNCVVTVSAEVAGRVEGIPLKEGAIVRKGDVLLRINADLIRPQSEVAEAQYVRDQIEFERISSLVKDNATSRKELDDATKDLSASKAQWEEARSRLERTKILAPSGGVLNSLPVEEGEYVQPGTAVAEVVDTQTVKVAVDVPQPDIAFFEIGQDTSVVADVKGCERTRRGRITFISAVADEQTRSTRVEITLDNTDGLLHSGQIVQAHLLRRVLKDVIFIPLLAVIPMENGKAVYVAESGQAQRRDVELGIIKGDRIQVTGGLSPGELLIVAGHRFVAPGQKIEIVAREEGGAGN